MSNRPLDRDNMYFNLNDPTSLIAQDLSELKKGGNSVDSQARADIAEANSKIEDLEESLASNTAQLVDKANQMDLQNRAINVMFPPSPFLAPKGDGLTDDTQALQNLINAAIQNGWNLYAPGKFVVSDTLLFAGGKISLGKGFKFTGKNVKETIFLSKTVNKPVFKFTNINDGSFEHAVEVRDFSVFPFDASYRFKGDGLVLENCVGHLFKNIKIGKYTNGLLLTTDNNTTTASTNTGYCEQNVFEDLIIENALKGITFKPGDNDTWDTSFHGNIFNRVTVSAIGTTTQEAIAINIQGGVIYNCTFNLKLMLGGPNCYMFHLNGDSGSNVGTITYEVFTTDSPKIRTGDCALTKFFFNGYIYGQLNLAPKIDWSEYKTVQVGELDYLNNKTPIVAGNSIIGRDKFYALNMLPDKQITSINLSGKTSKLKTLFNTLEDFWNGITHHFSRYQSIGGSQENGFVMATKEVSGAGSRFILGTIPADKNDIQDFVPGFEFRSSGAYINSVSQNSKIGFNPQGIAIYGNTLTINNTRTIASATSPGNPGEICWDANYLYISTGFNSWKRVPLTW